jgi:hypothetical protein
MTENPWLWIRQQDGSTPGKRQRQEDRSARRLRRRKRQGGGGFYMELHGIAYSRLLVDLRDLLDLKTPGPVGAGRRCQAMYLETWAIN